MFRTYLSKDSLSVVAVVVGLMAFWGCPDPQGRFDEFVERSPQGVGGSGGAGHSEVADLTGRFLLAAAVTLNPGAPLLFDAKVEMTPGCPAGACTIDMEIQPLNQGKGKGCPGLLEPVGPVIELKGVPVEADGTFVAVFSRQAVGTVAGCANPISGSDIEATLELHANTRSEDLFCGSLNGSLFKPFTYDLSGSTFGAIRIEDDTDLPTAGIEPVLACPAGGGGEGGAGGGGGSG